MSHSHSHSHGSISHDDHEEHEETEQDVFAQTLNAISDYEVLSLVELTIVEKNFAQLQDQYKKLIPNYEAHIKFIKSCIYNNYNFLLDVIFPHFESNKEIEKMKKMIPGGRKVRVELPPNKKYQTKPMDYDKIQSTLKQFVREWSEEGAEERRNSYGVVVNAIQKYFPKPNGIKVLCPGSGLGRLAFDVAKLGYISQGNEFSFYMLIPSNFILNRISKKFQYQIYPFIHQRSNHLARQDQLRGVRIPDVEPNSLPENSDFSMVAGDFLEVYSAQPNSWNCIATCFFIDTARNIFDYIDTIHTALKDDGIWVNFGPLLYHWSEMPGEFSMELSYDELKGVILESGFEILEDSVKNCSYATNNRSMLQMSYRCVFFVAKKKKMDKKVEIQKEIPLKPMFVEENSKKVESNATSSKKKNKK